MFNGVNILLAPTLHHIKFKKLKSIERVKKYTYFGLYGEILAPFLLMSNSNGDLLGKFLITVHH